MTLQLDLSGVPEYLGLIGVVTTALGGLCIKLYMSVRGLAAREKAREEAEQERKARDQLVWDAWRVEAEGRRQQMQSLTQQILELQTQNGKQQETILELYKELSKVHTENVRMKIEIDDLQKHNTELQGQVTDLIRGQHGNT